MFRGLIFAVAILLTVGRIGLGQEDPRNPSPEDFEPHPPVSDVANPLEVAADAEALPLRQEHIIYVPYENLQQALEDVGASVVLPYAELLGMWDRWAKPEAPAPSPPVAGVITRADYAGVVREDWVELDATLSIEVLQDGWARLPLSFGSAAIGRIQAEDEAVLLRGREDGKCELLVQGRGQHQIRLGLMAAVEADAEGRRFALNCPAVGISQLELELPEANLSVQVLPQGATQVVSEPGEPVRIRTALGATEHFAVHWQPAADGWEHIAGLANVTSMMGVDLGDGVVHTHAFFDYRILRGSLDELLVSLPDEQRLLDVQAAGLRDWQVESGEPGPRVRVRLHAPVTGEVRLELRTESPLPDSPFAVGQFQALGAARESGILAVRSAEDVGWEEVERQSLTRIDQAEVPESERRPGSTYYKFFTPDHRLNVLAAPHEPRMVVDSRLAVLLERSRVTLRGEFRYQVSRAGVFALRFHLPSEFQVDEVHTESLERFELDAVEGGSELTVHFEQRQLGDLAVQIVASATREDAAGEWRAPWIEPRDVVRESGLVAVIAPESFELRTESERLESAWVAAPGELSSRGFQPEIPAGSALAAAFAFVSRPVRIVSTITERPRRMLATVRTDAEVQEDVMQVVTRVDYQIRFAGTDTFRLAVPAGASERLEIEGEGIRERRQAARPDADGLMEWTIVLHAAVRDDFRMTLRYDQPLELDGDEGTWELQPIRVVDADRETGELAVHKDRALTIQAVATGLEEIDPRELSAPWSTVAPYLTYRYHQQPAQLELQITRHAIQEVVRTVVDRAYVEAVVTRDGPVRVRARYEVRSSERQRLAVALRAPRILSLHVAGQAVPPEVASAATEDELAARRFLINVARAGEVDEAFPIALVFETPAPGSRLGITDLLRLALPSFEEGVKFQKTYVRVWVPRDYRLVGNPVGFTSHIGVGYWDSRMITPARENPDTWFSADVSPFDFQVDGTNYLFSSLAAPAALEIAYWHIPTMTLIASVLALAVGVLLLWFSLETKVFTVLGLLFLVWFAGLFAPSLVNSWLLAARLGIAGVVMVWLAAWLLRVGRVGFSWPLLSAPAATVPLASDSGRSSRSRRYHRSSRSRRSSRRKGEGDAS